MEIGVRNKTTNQIYNKVYQLWYNMNRRCYCRNNPYYKNYGGKGITVCDRWKNLDNFIEDIDKIDGFDIQGFVDGKLSLDKDGHNNKIYSLEKCRFVSKEENNKIKPNQQKRFIAISPLGKESIWFNQSECSRELGIRQSDISKCLKGIRKTVNSWKFIYIGSCNDYGESQ